MKASAVILLISFIADQLLQLKTIRQAKHKDSGALMLHVVMWSFVMFTFSAVVMIKTEKVEVMIWWFIITIVHFIIEWCCIRMWTHYFYDKSKSLMVFWILLEYTILNMVMILLFDYLMV